MNKIFKKVVTFSLLSIGSFVFLFGLNNEGFLIIFGTALLFIGSQLLFREG